MVVKQGESYLLAPNEQPLCFSVESMAVVRLVCESETPECYFFVLIFRTGAMVLTFLGRVTEKASDDWLKGILS